MVRSYSNEQEALSQEISFKMPRQKILCSKCKKLTTNLAKHHSRNRCEMQHIRKVK
jgi:hypothetical protein